MQPVTEEERVMVADHITAASDVEVLAFRDGALAWHRGENGSLEDSDRYSSDMITRVAWRTGWMVLRRLSLFGGL